jgi:hypothetical protein
MRMIVLCDQPRPPALRVGVARSISRFWIA